MFVIDRSFQFWKEAKLTTLSQKVARSLKNTDAFELEKGLLVELDQRLEKLLAVTNQPFAKKAEIKSDVHKASKSLIGTLLKLADAVEKQCEYKSDVTLSGFRQGRVQRIPRYVKKVNA